MANPIVDWRIELEANEGWDLDLLVEHFQSSDCRVSRDEDGKCYLESVIFRRVQDHKKVKELARPLMSAMNGAAKIIAPWFQPVNSDKLTSVHENGARGRVMLAGPVVFRMPQSIPSRELHKGPSSEFGKAELWIQLSAKNRKVTDALRIFGLRPPTWTNLYNLYEIVREDVGGWPSIVANKWADEPELKRFRETANDPDAIGDDARHQRMSATKWNDTFQPMSHDEAKALLHRLLRGWLDSMINDSK